jgi:hypothetical protein
MDIIAPSLEDVFIANVRQDVADVRQNKDNRE